MAKPLDVLGLPSDATMDDVRTAYKRLAMKYHPDRLGGDEAKFKQLRTAYDALCARYQAPPFDDIFSEIARELKA